MDTGNTVFIVDDDPAVYDSLGMFLEATGLNVRTYNSAREFLDDYRSGLCGCLVLDLRMPEMSGLELQEALAEKHIEIPIIFITGDGDVASSVKALQGGAIDFLEKPLDNRTLLKRIQEAIRKNILTRHKQVEKATILVRMARLTPREKEVMRYMVASKSNKEIAANLGVSYRTVEVHRSRIFAKMETKSVTELTNMMILVEDWVSKTHH